LHVGLGLGLDIVFVVEHYMFFALA